MKFFTRITVSFILIVLGFFFFTSTTHALSVSNVGYKFCHYGPMDSKWGRNPKTDPWHAYWLCDAQMSSSQSKITIFWEADQVSDNFYVEYSTDRGATYIKSPSIVLNPKPLKHMWEFNALPSKTYYFRIRSQSMGDTDLHLLKDIRTNRAQGSVKYTDEFRIDFDVEYLNGGLRWQSYNFHNGDGGGCQTGNLDWRSGNFDCVVGNSLEKLRMVNNPPMTLTRFNDWFLENKGDHIYVSTLGAHEFDDRDTDDTSTAFLTIYAPNPAPFEFQTKVVPDSVSLRRGSSITAQMNVVNTSEADVSPQAVRFSSSNITGLPAGVTISGGAPCTPTPSCTIPITITADATAPIGNGYHIYRTFNLFTIRTRVFSLFTLNILPPLPGISITSPDLDESLVFRGTILQGTKHPDISFTVTNPLLSESPPLNYQITSDVSWLTVSPVTGTLRAGDNVTQVPVAISFSSANFRVQATPYKGTITIRDLNPENASAEKKIEIELTVTNTSDFSLAVIAPSTLVQGNSAGAKITISKTTGVASDIALSVSGLPAGVTGTFASSLCTASTLAVSPCVSVLTLVADASAAVGSKTVTISAKKPLDANGPAREQKKTFTLTVNKSFGVSLMLSPASLEVAPRGTGIVRVLATLSGAGAQEAKFGVEGLPSGASATFTPSACAQTCTATFSINAGSAAPGTSSVSIRAVGSGGTSVTGSLSLVIKSAAVATPRPTTTGQPGPTQIPVTPRPTTTRPPGGGGGESEPLSFSLITVRTLSVIQGSMTNTSIILSHDRGDAESVRLQVSQVPAHVTTSLSLTQCAPSCYSVLTLKTTEKTPLGNSNIKITASSEQAVRTAFVELIVGTDPPPTPTALLQKNVKDGARVGVGGTVREDRIVFSGTPDNVSAQKVRLRVEAKPVKEFFNGVTGVFEESARVVERGSSYELTGSKLLGGYKWRAQTVDERGIASQWTEFGANPDAEPDFITDLSTAPPNPFEGNQGEEPVVEEGPGFFRRIFGWVCSVPGVRRMCN